jgi:DNA-binding transcriptional regulator YiaG
MDKRTMREFDELCLTPVRQLKPAEIRSLRLREGASQAVFARYLNVTTGLVSQWERGEKRPQGASLKYSLSSLRTGFRLSPDSTEDHMATRTANGLMVVTPAHLARQPLAESSSIQGCSGTPGTPVTSP